MLNVRVQPQETATVDRHRVLVSFIRVSSTEGRAVLAYSSSGPGQDSRSLTAAKIASRSASGSRSQAARSLASPDLIALGLNFFIGLPLCTWRDRCEIDLVAFAPLLSAWLRSA